MNREDLKRRVGLKIRNIRKLLGLTQERFVWEYNNKEPRSVRMRRENLSRYETAKSMPEADRYEKILMMNPR
ncbi:hypothetical protein KAR91_12085 [Candidatus Pacearchaeota archaeon]|nr:hypothetical protein [Candidatus Pacearchaeota archaeon]